MGAYIYLVDQWLEEVGKDDGIKRVLRLGADGNPAFDKVGSTVSTLIRQVAIIKIFSLT